MCGLIKEQFRLNNFTFRHDEPYRFVTPEWKKIPQIVFLMWRVCWVIWHVVWLVLSIDDEGNEKWLIYLTNISYLMLVVQSVVYAIVVIVHTSKGTLHPKNFETKTPWYLQLNWFLTTLSFDTAVVVTILYWTLVYTGRLGPLSMVTHAINSVYVISDIIIYAIPVRIFHVVYVALYALLYAIFSVIYYVCKGTNTKSLPYIYKALDWSNTLPTLGLVAAVIFVAIPLIHLFQFALYTLRTYVHGRCEAERSVAPVSIKENPDPAHTEIEVTTETEMAVQ
ncbi:protein rolling stone-like [Physella acuta]|uniref:protein rolling stone-like n=1 Tax=Physella acuta TaxID=109671 RepID=UPI0027DC2C80|nr:protein rolling stone-like [Physella acuta]XP_059153679.1 protein rolling stone-like [Physella acuta]XP_059153687.1 protein rolling stone-like [Physella acuta]XP_059153694.1 protein rolling stone-like [Physella acuta]